MTLLIIAIGITCLVGILTAIDTVLYSMSDSFNRMGANSFYVYPARNNMHSRRKGKETKKGAPINFRQAIEFKENYSYPGSKVSINTFCKWNSTIKFGAKKTNPNIRTVGIDENYLIASAYELTAGRNFSNHEIENGDHKIIIGHDIVKGLFLSLIHI